LLGDCRFVVVVDGIILSPSPSAALLPCLTITTNFSGGWLLFSSYCSPLSMEMVASTTHSINLNPFAQQRQDNSGCLEWTAAKE
jgi:hypothetical protein